MSNDIVSWFTAGSMWANENQGVVSIALFLLTLAFGWLSGIFSSLRRVPNFRLELIPGPTLCSTFPLGRQHGGHEVHRSAISLYLRITNTGSASATVTNVSVGYHWHLHPFSWQWLRYRLFWFWIVHPSVSMDDFQCAFGDRIKVFPSLLQGSAILGQALDTFLEVGRAVIGVVYFEQDDSWGGCFPTQRSGRTRLKVAVTDSFGRRHTRSFLVPVVTLDEARKYNPSFGATLATLRGESASMANVDA